ncbi:MAG: FAD-dependent oxidoreductase, partial [Marinirhabdus sp.]
DIAIIGGGASGLGVAVDAASRGLKTLLLEQYDFAKGTSGKSTKLVHGGVRYLAQGNVRLVKTALEERGLLAKNAGHLFKKQQFVIPTYGWLSTCYYLFGLKIYDLLAKKHSLGASRFLKRKKVVKALPTLKTKRLTGGVSYFDGQFDDARLALNLAQTAVGHGAAVLNYCKVTGFEKEGETITTVRIEDTETHTQHSVKAKVIVNAAGIFTDKILKLSNPSHKKMVVPSQGIHLMLDAAFLGGNRAVMIPKTSDGRVLFVIPWHGKVIAGTTDTLIKKPKIEPTPLVEEVDFILNTLNTYLAKKVVKANVRSVFSGLRPLAKPDRGTTKTKEVSRSHKIFINGNLVSIVGGKWTTYRKMAEDVMNAINQKFNLTEKKSATRTLPIFGNIEANAQIPDNYLYIYGSQIDAYIKFEASHSLYKEKIHPRYPYTKGQLFWAMDNEMCRTVEDFLSRRIRLLLLDARAVIEAAPGVAALMAKHLNKDGTWEKHQISTISELAKNYLLQ